MKISIAGAGAGKTTKMADKIIASHESLASHLNIYCIAFTNNAAQRIENKLLKHFGDIPQRIKVSTIHSFLYQEIIRPYYYLLYGKQYEGISRIELPTDSRAKNWKLKQLDDKNIIHIEVFSQKAFWVMVKKSSDKKREKELRKVVELYPQNAKYITECHRCPQIHLDISNSLITKNERQESRREVDGTLSVIYERDVEMDNYIQDNKFDLMYISSKTDRYQTHMVETASKKFDTLYFELIRCAEKLFPGKSKIVIERVAYFWTRKLLNIYGETLDATKAMREVFEKNRLETSDYWKVIGILQETEKIKTGIVVNSIESIKGREGNNCVFILTGDLAEYLFGKKKTDNKTKNKLYVALTRSLENLTILITTEVEEKYGRDEISKHLGVEV